MKGWIAAIIVAVFLAVGGLGVSKVLGWRKDRDKAQAELVDSQKRVSALETAAEAEAKIKTVTVYVDRWHTKTVKDIMEKSDAEREVTAKALEESPDWASTPVPDAILRSLR